MSQYLAMKCFSMWCSGFIVFTSGPKTLPPTAYFILLQPQKCVTMRAIRCSAILFATFCLVSSSALRFFRSIYLSLGGSHYWIMYYLTKQPVVYPESAVDANLIFCDGIHNCIFHFKRAEGVLILILSKMCCLFCWCCHLPWRYVNKNELFRGEFHGVLNSYFEIVLVTDLDSRNSCVHLLAQDIQREKYWLQEFCLCGDSIMSFGIVLALYAAVRQGG